MGMLFHYFPLPSPTPPPLSFIPWHFRRIGWWLMMASCLMSIYDSYQVFLKVAERAKARLANDIAAPMRVTYLSERSVEDSLQVETSQNTWVVAVSYICMLVYISVALGRFPHRVRSRFLVGLLGIFIVVASMAISLGACSGLRLKTTLIIWEVRIT